MTPSLTISASGPAAGSTEARAVIDELQRLFAAIPPEPEVLVVGPRRNRADRRLDAAQRRKA